MGQLTKFNTENEDPSLLLAFWFLLFVCGKCLPKSLIWGGDVRILTLPFPEGEVFCKISLFFSKIICDLIQTVSMLHKTQGVRLYTINERQIGKGDPL